MSNLSENQMIGGWSSYHNLTSEDKEIFNEAMNGLVGVHYDPTSVSSQIVNGTNYRFKCNASIPPAEVIWEAIVEIYKPLNGKPHITGITRL